MKPLSEVAPGLLVIQIQIQAVYKVNYWTEQMASKKRSTSRQHNKFKSITYLVIVLLIQ